MPSSAVRDLKWLKHNKWQILQQLRKCAVGATGIGLTSPPPKAPQLVSHPRTPMSARLLGTLMWKPVVIVVALVANTRFRHLGFECMTTFLQK